MSQTHDLHLAKTMIRQPAGASPMVRVQPGEYYVTHDQDMTIATILGSCVAACMRNPRNGFGGMNHFMLPESETGHWGGVTALMRYGNHAMETLINAIIKSGCTRAEIEIKLFGGANIGSGKSTVGTQNALFAMEYLKHEGLRVLASDLGGNFGRRIHFHPADGKVKRLLLTENQNQKIKTSETRFKSTIETKPVEGDIELFD